MGTLVLFLTAPVWIPAVIILLVIGLKSDEKSKHQPSCKHRRYYYDEIDSRDLEADNGESYPQDNEYNASGSSDSILFLDTSSIEKGLPYRDREIFIVEHEDLIDQMDF